MFQLAICFPTRGFPQPAMVWSLGRFIMYFASNRVFENEEQQFLDLRPPIDAGGISATREKMINDLQETAYTHVLFWDDDMMVDPEAFYLMARRNVPMIGANYRKKQQKPEWVALSLDKKTRIESGNGKTGIERCWYSGFGFCLIKREVFDKVPDPRFLAGYSKEAKVYSCDDIAMALLAEQHGIPWYVDHDATRRIRAHIGNHYWGLGEDASIVYDYTEDWTTPHQENWKTWLSGFVGKPGVTGLEVGCFEGRSSIWFAENILTGPGSMLVCIDNFEGGDDQKHFGTCLEGLRKRFLGNIAKAKPNNIFYREGNSTAILSQQSSPLVGCGHEGLDFIYLDGSHISSDVFSDTCLSWPLLRHGGILIWDDYEWTIDPDENNRPKKAIDRWMSENKDQYDLIAAGWQVCIRKR